MRLRTVVEQRWRRRMVVAGRMLGKREGGSQRGGKDCQREIDMPGKERMRRRLKKKKMSQRKGSRMEKRRIGRRD